MSLAIRAPWRPVPNRRNGTKDYQNGPRHADVRMSKVGTADRDLPGHSGERCPPDETLRMLLSKSQRWESSGLREQQNERLEIQQGNTIVKRQRHQTALRVETMEPRELMSGLTPALNAKVHSPHALVKTQGESHTNVVGDPSHAGAAARKRPRPFQRSSSMAGNSRSDSSMQTHIVKHQSVKPKATPGTVERPPTPTTSTSPSVPT